MASKAANGGGAPTAAALAWSAEENAFKCVRCRAPTRPYNLCCDDCDAVAYCGDECKRTDAGAHARSCKALACAPASARLHASPQ